MTTIITWRLERAPGRNLKDFNTMVTISVKRKCRYTLFYALLTVVLIWIDFIIDIKMNLVIFILKLHCSFDQMIFKG